VVEDGMVFDSKSAKATAGALATGAAQFPVDPSVPLSPGAASLPTAGRSLDPSNEGPLDASGEPPVDDDDPQPVARASARRSVKSAGRLRVLIKRMLPAAGSPLPTPSYARDDGFSPQ
jgi:hypothetical protein